VRTRYGFEFPDTAATLAPAGVLIFSSALKAAKASAVRVAFLAALYSSTSA
jgi:hypothetical protein